MILKIETYVYDPTEGPYDPSVGPKPPQNRRKVFHMIDHVEDVKFGDVTPLTAVPHPMPMDDGTISEVELFTDEGGPTMPPDIVVNIIHFRQGGRAPRTVVSAGNIYLCNDAGDTLEVIRATN